MPFDISAQLCCIIFHRGSARVSRAGTDIFSVRWCEELQRIEQENSHCVFISLLVILRDCMWIYEQSAEYYKNIM